MDRTFDGRRIRDQILSELKGKIDKMEKKPKLAVFWIGENEVSGHYVGIKKKVAEDIGIDFELIKLPEKASEDEILAKIGELNQNPEVSGIMVQVPVPKPLNQEKIISAISPGKDIDGLRYCLGIESSFKPPVVLAILKAIEESGKKVEESDIAIIGHGFLVGAPLARFLSAEAKILSVGDRSTRDLSEMTKDADIVIAATGSADIIKPEMIKDGVVLIDAGTSEVSGEFKGDIHPFCYTKASYCTPVPGGIGPVTIAMLLKNLVG